LNFVEERRRPAAVLEAALAVLVRRSQSLHDPVEGHEFDDDELSHLNRPLPSRTILPPVPAVSSLRPASATRFIAVLHGVLGLILLVALAGAGIAAILPGVT
jgi:hypothetical protein